MYNYVFLSVILILLFVSSYHKNYVLMGTLTGLLWVMVGRMNREDFSEYKLPPYNYLKTGSDPLHFYRRDRYRKPYRYPFRFFSSYPSPYLTYGQ